MLAQCTRCQSIFPVVRFGPQTCPKCGAQTIVEDPAAVNPYAAPAAFEPEMPAFAADEPGEPTPWERRREIGSWNGFKHTVAAVFGAPAQIFGRMLPDTDDGALLYFALVSILPEMLAVATSWLRFDPETAEQVTKLFPPGFPEGVKAVFRFYGSPAGLGAALVALVLWRLFVLVAWAGSTHFFLRLLVPQSRGWTATYKTFVYSATPGLINIVPFCGGFVAFVWSCVVGVIGLSRIHRAGPLPIFGALFLGLVIPTCVLSCGTGMLVPLLAHK
jgi:hypothetical protein